MSVSLTPDSVHKIIDQCGLSELPDDTKELLATRMREQLEVEIGTKLFDRIDSATFYNFCQLREGEHDAVVNWLKENDPNFSELTLNGPHSELVEFALALFVALKIPGFRRTTRIALHNMQNRLRRQASGILRTNEVPKQV